MAKDAGSEDHISGGTASYVVTKGPSLRHQKSSTIQSCGFDGEAESSRKRFPSRASLKNRGFVSTSPTNSSALSSLPLWIPRPCSQCGHERPAVTHFWALIGSVFCLCMWHLMACSLSRHTDQSPGISDSRGPLSHSSKEGTCTGITGDPGPMQGTCLSGLCLAANYSLPTPPAPASLVPRLCRLTSTTAAPGQWTATPHLPLSPSHFGGSNQLLLHP